MFVRNEKSDVFRPENNLKESYYFVFGGKVLQSSKDFKGFFFEGCEATVSAGRCTFYHVTKGNVSGCACGAAYRNAIVDISDHAEMLYFNSASGIASLNSHVAAFDGASVELCGESSGMGQGFAKLYFSERSHGTVLGNAVAVATGESKVRMREQAFCLADGLCSVSAEENNVVYRLSKKAKVTLNKKSVMREVAESEISRYLQAFEAYDSSLGKKFSV